MSADAGIKSVANSFARGQYDQYGWISCTPTAVKVGGNLIVDNTIEGYYVRRSDDPLKDKVARQVLKETRSEYDFHQFECGWNYAGPQRLL